VFFIFLALFAVCAGLVFVISVFGVQGESFEEALEKQKKNQSKEKEKKKPTTEKKKKIKKGKDAKNNNIQDSVDENLLVDPSGHVVEPVFVEPVAAPTPPKKEVKREKKKEDKKADLKEQRQIPVEEPIINEEVAKVQCTTSPVHLEQMTAPVQEANVQKSAALSQEVPATIEPKPTVKEAKPEKKKIEIIEVDNDTKVEEADEKKKKKAPKDKSKKSNKSQCDEIMDIIRKSPLSDMEAQGIVDILLLKQTGKEENSDDWIEPGKENEAKKMARQIAELRVELEEESSKSANLEKKMVALRKEVNESKSVLAGNRRDHDDIVNKKTQEISSLNSRLQQVMGQLNQSVTLQRQLETNQSHYQATINNLQTQLSQVSNSAAADPKLMTEFEQLKNSRNELTASQHALQQKFSQKCAEVETLTAAKQQLEIEMAAVQADKNTAVQELHNQREQVMASKQNDAGQLEAVLGMKQQLEGQLTEAKNKLAVVTEEKQQEIDQLMKRVTAEKAQLEMKVQDGNKQQDTQLEQLESQLSAVTSAKQQVQKELNLLKDKMVEKENENSRLIEDNERLSEQVASSVERPAAEGEEATKMNGHQETEHQLEEVKTTERMWDEKYTKLQSQFQDSEERYRTLSSELQSTNQEVSKLREKNDASLKQLADYQQNCVEAFSRLFPGLDKSESTLSHLEKQAKSFIQDMEKNCQAVGQSEDLTEEVAKLEAQNSNYKTVLAQTENMLTNLESSVKSAEGEWKKKLETTESGCKKFKEALDQSTATNAELQNQIDALNNKIKDLECVKNELESEKSSKDVLAKKCAELQQMVAAGQQHINNHTNNDVVSNGTSSEA